jgi:hypothetical protein
LERDGAREKSLFWYFSQINAMIPAIEAFTDRKLAFVDDPDQSYSYLLTASTNPELFHSNVPMELYRTLVYLRHHGCPSPLLDWTQSENVAAFFAFCDFLQPSVERCAIYAYCSTTDGNKCYQLPGRNIRRCGPYVSTHKRHFLQRADYTICLDFKDSEWFLAPHEEQINGRNGCQDAVWKFTLPRSERIKVLRTLDSFNLNAFSLFQNEEGLMQTLWNREGVRRG